MLVPLQLPYTSITTQEYLGVTSSAAYYTICKEYLLFLCFIQLVVLILFKRQPIIMLSGYRIAIALFNEVVIFLSVA